MEILESTGSWFIALGKTLLNSLWLGLFLLSLLKGLFLIIPQRFPGLRYHAAFLTLLLLSVLTGVLFLLLFTPAQEVPSLPPGGTPFRQSFSFYIMDGGLKRMPIYLYLSLSYITGLLIVLLTTIFKLRKIRSIRCNAITIKSPWPEIFQALKIRAGIRRNVELMVSESIAIPFLTGIVKPAVIVPAAMLSHLSLGEIESILMHELYHLKRLDNLMNLVQRLVELIFFFNPAIWILSEMISSEREKRCDDLVLKGHKHPLEYARALYQLSLQQAHHSYLASAATGKSKGELKGRIERILKPNNMKINYREKTNALLIFFCGVAMMLLVSGFTSGLSISNYNERPNEATPELMQSTQIASDTLTQAEKKQIQEEVERAMSEIDLEAIKKEIEEITRDVMADIDLEAIKKEMDQATRDAMADIDLEAIKKEMDQATRDVMAELDWDEIRKEMDELSETIKVEIDWEEIKKELDEARLKIDLMMEDFDIDFDFDMDLDTDVDTDDDSDEE